MHKQEVCGLKWNGQLARGGNDNKLLVWDHRATGRKGPLWKFHEHSAAVKAIAWSPHNPGVLDSGGGTQDKKMRFWNTQMGTLLAEVDTGSQVRAVPSTGCCEIENDRPFYLFAPIRCATSSGRKTHKSWYRRTAILRHRGRIRFASGPTCAWI